MRVVYGQLFEVYVFFFDSQVSYYESTGGAAAIIYSNARCDKSYNLPAAYSKDDKHSKLKVGPYIVSNFVYISSSFEQSMQ